MYSNMMKTNPYQVKPYDIEKLRKEREKLKKEKNKKPLSVIQLIRQSNRLSAMLENEFM